VSRVILIVMDVTRGGLGMEKMEGREDVEGRCGVHRSDWAGQIDSTAGSK
jgi:hypothetical protein